MTEEEANQLKKGDKVYVREHSSLWQRNNIWNSFREQMVGGTFELSYVKVISSERHGSYISVPIDSRISEYVPIAVLDKIVPLVEDHEIIL